MIITTNAAPIAIALPAPTAVAGFYPFSFYTQAQGIGAITYTPPAGVTIGGNPTLTITTNQAALHHC